MQKPTGWRFPALLLLSLPLMGGCVGMGWEDVLTGVPIGGNLRGEVSWVDQRRREIGIRSGWGGAESVRYDSRTKVVYRQRNYRVTDLERGDLVTVMVDSNSRGGPYARTVRVERSVRDGGRSSDRARVQRFDGRVTWIDRQRREFGIESGRTERVVTVRARDRDTQRRFERLRRGNRVRFEGVSVGRNVIELRRFR